jgi:dipeptidyl aminopeptidase/acylaminoacyl peptidase
MPRSIEPADLYALRVPTDPRLSPDGRLVSFTVQSSAPRHDGYRHAVWLAPSDGSAPGRQVTLGAKHDRRARFSPDGRTLAFLSDRRPVVEEEPDAPPPDQREDSTQVHLLPLEGGEARRLTNLPRGVDAFEWSPDGSRLAVLSASVGATRAEDDRRRRKRQPKPGDPPDSDYHYLDRLGFMFNAAGFVYNQVAQLWIVDVATGAARRLTDGRGPVESPAWSPDGRRIAFAANRGATRDLAWLSTIWVSDVETGAETQVTGGRRSFFDRPAWLPDGRSILALGHRFPAAGGSRNDVWRFAADGSEAGPDGGRDLSARHDLMPGAALGSDLTPEEPARLIPSSDGASVLLTAPIRGSYELWRLDLADGALERLTAGSHYLSGWDAVPAGRGRATRVAFVLSSPTATPDVHVLDVVAGRRRAPLTPAHARRVSAMNDDALADVRLIEPEEHWSSVDGREIQGWYLPPTRPRGARGPAPLVLEIHGGPHTLYGWAPTLEFQVLGAAGIGVYYANPRGSEGYGQAFNAANFADWGDGPTRDVLAGVDALVAEGRADPERLGVTGGSYGGYLTSWIVGHTDRFRAAITCRSVNDLTSQMTTGDIAGPEFGRLELGAAPWEDPDLYRALSPVTYARNIRTPLLIQHSEKDLRTPIGQAEELFSVLRSLRRPVRMMRVPEETHELTRSGTPFRRVENLVQVRAWFRHYLVDGRRGLPPIPRVHGGR